MQSSDLKCDSNFKPAVTFQIAMRQGAKTLRIVLRGYATPLSIQNLEQAQSLGSYKCCERISQKS